MGVAERALVAPDAARGRAAAAGRRNRAARLAGGAAAALVGAVLFGGTFIGVSTMALAAGRLLQFPGAVALLTAGYSVGQIVGPVLVTPLLAHGFQHALIAAALVVVAAAVVAALLRSLSPTRPVRIAGGQPVDRS